MAPRSESYGGGAGGGIRTHEPLRDRVLSPAPLTWLGNPRLEAECETSQIKPCVGDEFTGPVLHGSLLLLFLRLCRLWLWRDHLGPAGPSWNSSVFFYLSESLLPVSHLSIFQELVEDL